MSQSDFYWLQRSIVANIWIFAPKMAAAKMWFYQSICSSFGFNLRYELRKCIENSALCIASKWLHSFLVDPVADESGPLSFFLRSGKAQPFSSSLTSNRWKFFAPLAVAFSLSSLFVFPIYTPEGLLSISHRVGKLSSNNLLLANRFQITLD